MTAVSLLATMSVLRSAWVGTKLVDGGQWIFIWSIPQPAVISLYIRRDIMSDEVDAMLGFLSAMNDPTLVGPPVCVCVRACVHACVRACMCCVHVCVCVFFL